MKGGGSSTDKKEIGKKRMKERKKLRFIGFQWKKNGGEKRKEFRERFAFF